MKLKLSRISYIWFCLVFSVSISGVTEGSRDVKSKRVNSLEIGSPGNRTLQVETSTFPVYEDPLPPNTILGQSCFTTTQCEESIVDSTCVLNTCQCKHGYEPIAKDYCDRSPDVTILGQSCFRTTQCKETVIDSTCVLNTCQCNDGYEPIGNYFCDRSSDADHYNVPSQTPILMCSKTGSCDSSQGSCKTKFVRRLSGYEASRDSAGLLLYKICGLNIRLNLSVTDDTRGRMYVVNTVCYFYESPDGRFSVAQIKVKVPFWSFLGREVSCTLGNDSCTLYKHSGSVLGFFAGIPADCVKGSSLTIFPELRLIFLAALILILSRSFRL